MRVLRLLLPCLALCFLAMAERGRDITVRYFAEANQRDGAPFSTPIKLGNPPRDAFLQKVPTIHERHIRAIYPFRAPDGTWGCAFKLDESGRLALEVVSTDKRGSYLVGFISTKQGQHPLPHIVIDRTVSDGIISVPRGLTDLIIAHLAREYKVLGGVEVPKLPKEKRTWWGGKKKPQPAASAN